MVERVRPVTYRIPLARKPPTSPQKLISLVTPAGRRRHGIVNDPKNIWTQLKMEKELQPRCHRSYVSADAGLKTVGSVRGVWGRSPHSNAGSGFDSGTGAGVDLV